MPVRIRLQRHGKKGKPFYWVVAADSRAKRDGRYLEKIGTYNPNTQPATIDLNADAAVRWLQNGAQPSDTAKNILSYTGVLLKNHLLNGVKKGALSQEDADAKFEAWLAEKVQKIEAKKSALSKEKANKKSEALAAEKEANEKRLAAQAAEIAAEEAAPEAEVATETEEVAEEATPEAEVVAENEEVAEESAPEAEVVAETETVVEEAAPEAEVATETEGATESSEEAEK